MTEEPPVAEEPAEVAETEKAEEAVEVEEQPAKVYTTKQEVIDRLKEIAHSDETPQKTEVELLKTTFYKLHFAEREEQQKAYLDAGGDPETYQVMPDQHEEVF